MVTRDCKKLLGELCDLEKRISQLEGLIGDDISESQKEKLLLTIINNYSIFKSSKAS